MKLKIDKPILLLILILVFAAGCKKDDEEKACNITGTITDHGNSNAYDGLSFIFYIDADTITDNSNYIGSFSGTFSGNSISYTADITSIPKGTYYIYLLMDFSGNYSMVGMYGVDAWPIDAPDSPNAVVDCDADFSFEIYG